MGGFGSGRPKGSGRDKVEACRSIDVNTLNREGCLTPGWRGGWQWTSSGEQVASVNLHAENDNLHLAYRVRLVGEDRKDVAETVHIVRVDCQFGGARLFFVCPGVGNGTACGRRVVKLLCGPERYFLCRHCCGVVYSSQCEGLMDRSLRRANKIRARLGGDPGIASPFPARPKGMWARTYEHLCQQALDLEVRADQAMAEHTAWLLAGTDKPKETGGFWA